MKLLSLLLGCGLMMIVSTHAAPSAPDTVVLLHGLGRTSFSMTRLAQSLERDGYRVLNLSYSSRTKSLEALATEWLPAELARAGPKPDGSTTPPRLHFVTHSMGGIVVRLWLREKGAPENLGRVVMLAPPNGGSEVSDRFHTFPPFRWFTGENGRRLTTGPDALPAKLGPWPCPSKINDPAGQPGELGVIAGTHAINPVMAAWLPAPNDGKVSVAATHLAGERDHLALPFSHTWLGWRGETLRQVKVFLREGQFAR